MTAPTNPTPPSDSDKEIEKAIKDVERELRGRDLPYGHPLYDQLRTVIRQSAAKQPPIQPTTPDSELRNKLEKDLRRIIYIISQHPLDDEDHEYDEEFDAAIKALTQIFHQHQASAVLEAIGEDEFPKGETLAYSKDYDHWYKPRNHLRQEIRNRLQAKEKGNNNGSNQV